MTNKECDVVETVCGPFGKWQLRTILIIYLVKIPSAWFMVYKGLILIECQIIKLIFYFYFRR